jgi:D-arabinose 5-phosphate isomerase GutQ
MNDSLQQFVSNLESSLQAVEVNLIAPVVVPAEEENWVATAIAQRAEALAASVTKTVTKCPDIERITRLFLHWMREETIVRVLGAGRARLAAAIPANRLAHGGARVFVQDAIMPMPHTVKGGGVLAASASGKTLSVLQMMQVVREEAPHIVIVGIAKSDAQDFRDLCHYFIGIEQDAAHDNPLAALADIGEYVISEVLDAIVVAAGKLGGFDDRKWRLGHENIGPTGPYDARVERVDLLFNAQY